MTVALRGVTIVSHTRRRGTVRTAAIAIMVRLPVPLHERARRKAFRDRTSLNKLVIAALERYLRPAARKGAAP